MEDCIFCKIVSGDGPKTNRKHIYEDEEIVVFPTLRPKAPIHLLVVPKAHIENVGMMKEEDIRLLGKMQWVARQVAEKMKIDDGFQLHTNSGKLGGQEVMHLHYHLTGGWKES